MQPLIDNNDQEGMAQGYAPEELVQYAIENGNPDFAPGEGWKYSSTNFILLGLAVEEASGNTLSELYQMQIFDALGMNTAAIWKVDQRPEQLLMAITQSHPVNR